MKKAPRLSAVLLAVLLFGVLPATAIAGDVQCGAVVSGNLTLTHDIGPCAGDGITVRNTTGQVTIDLAGYTIKGDSNNLEKNAGIVLDRVSGVTVKNGAVRDFNVGLLVYKGSSNVIRDVTAAYNLGAPDAGGLTTSYGDGVVVFDSSFNLVKGNVIKANGPFSGVNVMGDSDSNVVDGNLISGNMQSDGMRLGDLGIRLEQTPALCKDAAGNSKVCSTTSFEEELIDGTGGATDNNVVSNNTVLANSIEGIGVFFQHPRAADRSATGNKIFGNTIEANVRAGIRLHSNRNTHTEEGNTPHWETAANFNEVYDNTLCGNGGGIAAWGHGNVIKRNQAGDGANKIRPGHAGPGKCLPNLAPMGGVPAADVYDDHGNDENNPGRGCTINQWGSGADKNTFTTEEPTCIPGEPAPADLNPPPAPQITQMAAEMDVLLSASSIPVGGMPRATSTATAIVRDPVSSGPIPGVEVVFSATGDVTVDQNPKTTDANGRATAVVTASTTPGTQAITATTQLGTSASADLTEFVTLGPDFTGDGLVDIGVFRPSAGSWLVPNQPSVQWGASTDKIVPADYNGDRRTDVAVYRPENGVWYIRNGASTQWGASEDIPVPGDYDNDGDDDVAVYRPSSGTWFVKDGQSTQWGAPEDIPVPADYNGDGRTDIAVYRHSTGIWYVKDGLSQQWGGHSSDIPVPADYDGDGDADIAVYRGEGGIWYPKDMAASQWGGHSSDIPVPADYNSDGKAEPAIYRADGGFWYPLGGASAQWGGGSDRPLTVRAP